MNSELLKEDNLFSGTYFIIFIISTSNRSKEENELESHKYFVLQANNSANERFHFLAR